MVVTRRQSAGPIPPVASRTNSAIGASRTSNMKGKAVDKNSPLKETGAGPSRVPPNGTPSRPPPVGPQALEDITFDDDVSPTPPKPTITKPKPKNKSKKSPKTKKRQPNKGISIFDILGRLFLLWFTIYTLSVCPEDVELRSPVCRALTEYRRVILEPYVYPPIRAALDHPSVAPHIRRAEPYYNRAVMITKPLIRRGKYEWRAQVVPRIQWVQLRARPYVRRVERQYEATLGPYAQQVSAALTRYLEQTRPYVLAASLKTRRKWTRARPYLLPLWKGASRVPEIVIRVVGKPLGDARRQWVDPHVAKIWDAVVEKGNADKVESRSTIIRSTVRTSTSTLAPSPSEPPTTRDTSRVPLEDVPEPSDNGAYISPPPVPEPTAEAAALASSVIVSSASVKTSSSSLVASAINNIPEPSVETSLVVVPPIPEPTDEAALSASSVIQESLSGSVELPDPTSSDTSAEPPLRDEEHPIVGDDDVIEDLEEFLSEIGIDESEVSEAPPPPPTPTPSSPPVMHQDTPEEIAERLRLKAAETAEKRADIEGRHDQWEIDLEKFGKAQRKVVRATLKGLREAAAEEAHTPGAAVRMHIEALVQEAEKSLKSLKAYSRKLAGEDKSREEKLKTWETVVMKVDKKFGERVDAAATGVRDWWDAYVEKENQEVAAISDEVAELAHRAQADLGMDYTWLADVSYYDWQRYHKLVDKSKEFADMYRAMQNGTLANAPVNPVSDVIEALQEEVDDFILGFEASLDRIKTATLEMLSGKGDTKTAKSAPTSTAGSEPEVSILPIDPIVEKVGAKIPPIILSRDAEEVEAAVRRAEEAKTSATHEEL